MRDPQRGIPAWGARLVRLSAHREPYLNKAILLPETERASPAGGLDVRAPSSLCLPSIPSPLAVIIHALRPGRTLMVRGIETYE
jgi:hypothetical protein